MKSITAGKEGVMDEVLEKLKEARKLLRGELFPSAEKTEEQKVALAAAYRALLAASKAVRAAEFVLGLHDERI